MSISIEEFRAELLDHLGLDKDDIEEAELDLLLNRSWWEVQGKFKFREAEKVKSADITIGGSSRRYDQFEVSTVGPDPFNEYPVSSIMNAFIVDPVDNKQYTMEQVGQVEFTNMREANMAIEPRVKGRPTHFYLRDNRIFFWPTPDRDYVLRIHFRATLANVEEDGVVVPLEWHEIILLGAVWRGFLKMGDYNRGNAAKAHQVALINSTVPTEAKEIVANTGYAGLQVIRKTRR